MSFYETEISLPSKGVFYEDGLDTLRMRNLDTQDEQRMYGSDNQSAIDTVLSNCILEPKGFDVNKLVPGDKAFFMTKLRIHTYGSMYKQPFYCIHCNKDGNIEYDLDTIEVKELSNIKLPIRIKLPVSKDVLELHVLTSGDILNINKRAKKTADNTKASVKSVSFILRLSKQIKSINDQVPNIGEKEVYIRNLHAQDRAYINSAFNQISFGYSDTVEVTCPHCGKDLVIPVEMTGEFFNPSFEVEFL